MNRNSAASDYLYFSSFEGFFSNSNVILCEVASVPLVLQISSANIPAAGGRVEHDFSTLLRRKSSKFLWVRARSISRARPGS